MNITDGITVTDSPISMVLNAFCIGYFPYSVYSPILWIDGYTNNLLIIYTIIQIFSISVLTLQHFKGARFMFPQKYQKMVYDQYKCKLDYSLKDTEDNCHLCLNSLDGPELEYFDLDKSYKYIRFEQEEYFKIPCGHQFHPNCLLKKIEEKRVCPI